MDKQFLRRHVLNSTYDKVVWEEELNLNKADTISMKLLEIGESFITNDPFISIERVDND